MCPEKKHRQKKTTKLSEKILWLRTRFKLLLIFISMPEVLNYYLKFVMSKILRSNFKFENNSLSNQFIWYHPVHFMHELK